jgi:hypothetical protein
MRAIPVWLAIGTLVAGLLSCGRHHRDPAQPQQPRGERATKYRRIAIVCAPAPGADPSYAEMIMSSARPNVPSRLGFLTTCDSLSGVSVDTTTVPPRCNLGEAASKYDGVICLVYAYGDGHAILHFYLVDTQTGAQAWYYKLDSRDANTVGRLTRHGWYVPTIIKIHCYGL